VGYLSVFILNNCLFAMSVNALKGLERFKTIEYRSEMTGTVYAY